MNLLTNLDALLITNPTNIRYLTGFVGAAPEEREAYCLLAQESAYLFTNALYRENAKKLTRNPVSFKRLNLLGSLALQGLTFIEISREEPFAKKLAEILTGSRPVRKLGFEENNVTVAEYKKIEKELNGVTLVPTQGRIEELRMIKREDEIENIKAAAKITDECFKFVLKKIKPGIRESDIAMAIEAFIRTHGAELAFPPIVAFGTNTSQPHYQSSDMRLQSRDIILMDFGARVNGYCSDMTRMVFVGKPKDEWIGAYKTVLEAQQKALGALSSKADQIAREVIKKSGFPVYPHSLGHGVGLDIHEAPRLTIKKDATLQPGMVVTVEPGIYIEGSYGVRLEDLVLLKKDGIEIVSTSTKKIIIL